MHICPGSAHSLPDSVCSFHSMTDVVVDSSGSERLGVVTGMERILGLEVKGNIKYTHKNQLLIGNSLNYYLRFGNIAV